MKKEADHSRLIGGRFNKQRAHAPIRRVLSAFINTVMEFGHLYSLDGLSNTVFSQSCILEVAPSMRIVGRKNISGMGGRGGG